MEEEYWLKFGFKENGKLVCVRTVANSKPSKTFFYTENGKYKAVKNGCVIKLTSEVIEKINRS